MTALNEEFAEKTSSSAHARMFASGMSHFAALTAPPLETAAAALHTSEAAPRCHWPRLCVLPTKGVLLWLPDGTQFWTLWLLSRHTTTHPFSQSLCRFVHEPLQPGGICKISMQMPDLIITLALSHMMALFLSLSRQAGSSYLVLLFNICATRVNFVFGPDQKV